MQDAAERLPKAVAPDYARAFAIISEAVWWITIVDATLVRYHPEVYDRVLCEQPDLDRPIIEATLSGLRFVRNQLSRDIQHVDFVSPPDGGPEAVGGRIAEWTWNPLPEPTCESLSTDGRQWELDRYHAYQTRLARSTVDETFRRAVGFLNVAAEQAGRVISSGPR